jgi:hypothetical protein
MSNNPEYILADLDNPDNLVDLGDIVGDIGNLGNDVNETNSIGQVFDDLPVDIDEVQTRISNVEAMIPNQIGVLEERIDFRFRQQSLDMQRMTDTFELRLQQQSFAMQRMFEGHIRQQTRAINQMSIAITDLQQQLAALKRPWWKFW